MSKKNKIRNRTIAGVVVSAALGIVLCGHSLYKIAKTPRPVNETEYRINERFVNGLSLAKSALEKSVEEGPEMIGKLNADKAEAYSMRSEYFVKPILGDIEKTLPTFQTGVELLKPEIEAYQAATGPYQTEL